MTSVSMLMWERDRKPTYAPTNVTQAKSSEASSSVQVRGLFKT